MTSPDHRIQVLYELSLSVGSEGNLTETARSALSAYLRKLNCSAGAVFERRATRDSVTYDTVTMIPSKADRCDGLRPAIARLPETSADEESFRASLPVTEAVGGAATYYLMDLPEFGVLALVAGKQALDSQTVAALGPLNEKLATACRGERYEHRLRAERDRFEAIFTTIDEPLVSVRRQDGDCRVQRINPAFESTFGCAEGEAIDRPLSSVLGPAPTGGETLPPLDGEALTTKIRRATTEGTGEFLVRSTPISPDSDGSESLVLFVDITEAATRQRRLERFHEVTKALSRILRHNIRNDLTVIQALAERIRDDTEGPPAEDARAILRKSEQLASTAEKAREMRELVATRDREPSVPLDAAITDAIDAVRRAFPGGDITVDIDVPDGTTTFPSIGIAVRHLVENGIEHHDATINGSVDAYADEPPRVAVSVTAAEGDAVITVRDNGPGIPESEVAILERGTETPLEHGTGAGLWIVGQIIDYCDATIAFSRTDGTTATIRVPN